jgi:hypothetical protein
MILWPPYNKQLTKRLHPRTPLLRRPPYLHTARARVCMCAYVPSVGRRTRTQTHTHTPASHAATHTRGDMQKVCYWGSVCVCVYA